MATSTDGATASAIQERLRRAVLRAIDRDPGGDPPVPDDAVLASVVADFTWEEQALSRALLGGGSDGSTESGDLAAGFDGQAHGRGPSQRWLRHRCGR